MQELLSIFLRLGYELLLVWLLWTAWISGDGGERLLSPLQTRGQLRQRHPQSPRDCPVCRAAHEMCETHTQRVVEPWAKRKSKRGRPRAIDTEGYGCPNPLCPYYKITDAPVHALVGDGRHYGADTIQNGRCQACHTKFSVRRGTPMYDLKTPTRR